VYLDYGQVLQRVASSRRSLPGTIRSAQRGAATRTCSSSQSGVAVSRVPRGWDVVMARSWCPAARPSSVSSAFPKVTPQGEALTVLAGQLGEGGQGPFGGELQWTGEVEGP
jgi:hypothetical protein